MFAVCVITLLILATVSHSAPLPCEELVQPLDQLHLHHLEGRRALIAASLSDPSHLEKFKSRDSASINFANDTSQISFTGAYGFRDSCQYLHTNVTLEGSSFTWTSLWPSSIHPVKTVGWCALTMSQRNSCVCTCSARGDRLSRRRWMSSAPRLDVWICLPSLWWILAKNCVQSMSPEIQQLKLKREQRDRKPNWLRLMICGHTDNKLQINHQWVLCANAKLCCSVIFLQDCS